jgi:hypothetical protein
MPANAARTNWICQPLVVLGVGVGAQVDRNYYQMNYK